MWRLTKVIAMILSGLSYFIYKINESAETSTDSILYEVLFGGLFMVTIIAVFRSWIKNNN